MPADRIEQSGSGYLERFTDRASPLRTPFLVLGRPGFAIASEPTRLPVSISPKVRCRGKGGRTNLFPFKTTQTARSSHTCRHTHHLRRKLFFFARLLLHLRRKLLTQSSFFFFDLRTFRRPRLVIPVPGCSSQVFSRSTVAKYRAHDLL